jgi:hypothetical protein
MMLDVPTILLEVRYNGRRVPGSAGPRDLSDGANCQVFAYALLRHHGVELPPFRSSELWADTEHTAMVAPPYEPLDLLLFNSTANAFGAHVAVCVNSTEAIHLSKRVGRPVIWPIARFAAETEYEILIAAKRPVRHRIFHTAEQSIQ